MIKKEWLFMQTPKEKAYNLYKKFYNVMARLSQYNE